MATKSEIKYLFCNEHIENAEYFLKKNHPSYIFNTYYAIKADKKCCYTNCKEIVGYEAIGIQIPEVTGELFPKSKIRYEIFNYAKSILINGPASIRLKVYLKAIIIPINKSMNCEVVLKHYSDMLLTKLKIDKEAPLTDKNINSIIGELGLYPE